jgi:hypothetical protein
MQALFQLLKGCLPWSVSSVSVRLDAALMLALARDLDATLMDDVALQRSFMPCHPKQSSLSSTTPVA